MKTETVLEDLRAELGADRVLAPRGALPQPAERLDPNGPVRPHELEVAVERLCLDSTSHRNLWERADGDPARMADRITEIVEARGKMHNPETDSGGVLLGIVTAAGERYGSPPAVGDRIVTLGSLTLTPLRLESIERLDPDSPQVEVTGTAYVAQRAAWAPLPADLPLAIALDVFDVCAAASQTRTLVPPEGTVYVLGAGNAGKLALATARDVLESGIVVAIDADADAVDRVAALGLCDIGVTTDLRDPIGALEAVRRAEAPPADLTVVVVNAVGCEPAAILMTTDGGTVLFFSMATRFGAAALAADGTSTSARMLVGSGYSPDRGAYALELLRRSPELRESFGLQVEALG
jgi:L-erythro-3,5-diaminohexanoate dehydrogenase